MEKEVILQRFHSLLRVEEKEQEERWLDKTSSLKEMRKKGVVIYPIKIRGKKFGFTNQPILTVSFFIPEGVSQSLYKEGMPVALFLEEGKEVCNGQIRTITATSAELILFSDDFPDWMEENKLGIKRLPDSRSFQAMHGVLNRLEEGNDKEINKIFDYIHGNEIVEKKKIKADSVEESKGLNTYQNNVIQEIQKGLPVQIIHGPPGTGKTTTMVALIQSLRKKGGRVIASAPSNAAIDHLAKELIQKGISVLRLGNTTKVNKEVWKQTPEGILSQQKYAKELKKLRIQAEDYIKKARQFKRNFRREEREKRKEYYKEARLIKKEIKNLIASHLLQYLETTDVVLGTPVGLTDSLLRGKKFDVAILEEAGQCMEPLSWLVMEKAERIILGGDHLQIPPTIISREAEKGGLGISILERAIRNGVSAQLLPIQYRMTPEIAGFSSRYFYQNKLKNFPKSIPNSLLFYDTAGAGMEEKKEENSQSLYNPEELRIVAENLNLWKDKENSIVFISPYSAQIERAKKVLKGIKISTIDSFQGQEANTIILSLVRSNPNGEIGFLSDYRRMNVALTRAQSKLIVLGDSTTLTKDKFYQHFVEYTEEIKAYHSVFELMY